MLIWTLWLSDLSRFLPSLYGFGRRISNSPSEASAAEDDCLNTVSFVHKGKPQQLDCKTLLVHKGVIPQLQLSRSIGLKHQWSDAQQCWRSCVGPWGECGQGGIFMAVDGAALAAEQRGVLSALQISRQLAIRPFLDQLYKPAAEFINPRDETVVCRWRM